MSIYSQYYTNKDQESRGVWQDFPDAINQDGSIPGFLIRRSGGANGTEYGKAFERAKRPFAGVLAGNPNAVDNDVSLKILVDAFVDSILVDWRNIQDLSGQNVSYTPEAAKRVFIDLPDLFQVLNQRAGDLKTFQQTIWEADSKNS